MMSSEKIDTRTRILKAALKLLESGTGSEVRMSDIAREVGISRQALYLHFPNRAELLIETTRYLDRITNTDARLAASRSATSGTERLDTFIEAWGGHIPEIYGVAKALWAMQDSDKEAKAAWENRMQALREGYEAAVKALKRDGELLPELSMDEATDILSMLLSVRSWEHLTVERGWSQDAYIRTMKTLAQQTLVSEAK